MPEVFKAAETTAARKAREFYLVDSNGDPATAATVTVRVLNDGADAVGAGTVSEVSAANRPGLYLYTFADAEIATAGPAVIRASATGAVTADWGATVVDYDPYAAPATEAEIASAVRTELTVEVGRIDTNLSDLPTAAENADAVWDEARTDHTTAGTYGEGAASVQGNVTGSVASVTGAVGSVTGAVGSVAGNVGGNVTGTVGSLATQAKTDVRTEATTALSTYDAPTKAELDAGLAALNDLDSTQVQITAAAALTAYDPATGAEAAAIQADTDALQAALTAAQADITAILADTGTDLPALINPLAAYVDTDVGAIREDTGTTLPATLDALNTLSAAIRAKTNSLTFTVAGQLDANVQSINDALLAGDGSTTPWGPA